MAQWVIARDGARDLRFNGEQLATVQSEWTHGRRLTLALYRTDSGRYVCERIGSTQWQGEHDRHESAVCDTVQGVSEFFGFGHLSKLLYDAAGIDASEPID